MRSAALAAACCALVGAGCDTPSTSVVLDNDYPAYGVATLVVVQAAWENATFTDPLLPGQSSAPQATVAASENTAYVVVAPGWDPSSGAAPAALVVLQSRSGFALHWDQTLHIPVDDAHFTGNCAAGSPLTQAQADVVTGYVFPGLFASYTYDAATCTATPIGDAGAAEGGP